MPQRLTHLLIGCLLVLTACSSNTPTVTDRSQPAARPAATLTATQPATPRPTLASQPTIAPSEPAQAATTIPAPDASGEWQTYTNAAGGYSLAIPAAWGVAGEPAASVQFFDQQHAAVHELATGEPEYFAGGVDILGLIASEPDPYLAVLPNQSAIVAMWPIETPLGAGRVYTLRRDRFKPAGSDTVWYAQHALIPANDRIYEVWVNVDAAMGGEPVPTLRRMLSELRLEAAP